MKNTFVLAIIAATFLFANTVFPQPEMEENVQEVVESPPAASNQSFIEKSVDQNKVSLDVKGMDICDVLRMLATRAGLNIVIGKNVSGRVVVLLKDVDIWDAFEIILLANDLAFEKKGNIINVMTQRDYELQYGQRYQDRKQLKTIRLSYAKAADLSRALNQIKTNIGRVVVDENSNTITLIDVPEQVAFMENFIKNTGATWTPFQAPLMCQP